jgi:DNA-binding transcriptional MerR regulator
MVAHRGEWTLSEAARLLGQPQHRLIYLCEKGVVHPDVEDARGRGSSRRFSARNLLEFAVALQLRALELPASAIGAITYTLRAFERQVQRQTPDFRLPESLRGPGAPDLRVLISDGRLYVALGTGKDAPKLFGGIEFRRPTRGTQASARPARGPLPATTRTLRQAADRYDRRPGENGHARMEINITRLAQELRLEA